jgi:hypothetical protein
VGDGLGLLLCSCAFVLLCMLKVWPCSPCLAPCALLPVFIYVLGWVVTRQQAGGDMRRGGTDSLSKDIVVEGFSITVGGKTLFDNADLRISHGQVARNLNATAHNLPTSVVPVDFGRRGVKRAQPAMSVCNKVDRVSRNVDVSSEVHRAFLAGMPWAGCAHAASDS